MSFALTITFTLIRLPISVLPFSDATTASPYTIGLNLVAGLRNLLAEALDVRAYFLAAPVSPADAAYIEHFLSNTNVGCGLRLKITGFGMQLIRRENSPSLIM